MVLFYTLIVKFMCSVKDDFLGTLKVGDGRFFIIKTHLLLMPEKGRVIMIMCKIFMICGGIDDKYICYKNVFYRPVVSGKEKVSAAFLRVACY